jgi:hypothetical protein
MTCVTSASNTSCCSLRKSLSVWWFTETLPQILRYAVCISHRLAISLALPSPSLMA